MATDAVKLIDGLSSTLPDWYVNPGSKYAFGIMGGYPFSVSVQDDEVNIRAHAAATTEALLTQDDLDETASRSPGPYRLRIQDGDGTVMRVGGAYAQNLPAPAEVMGQLQYAAYHLAQRAYMPACDGCRDFRRKASFIGYLSEIHYLCENCMPTIQDEIKAQEQADAKGSFITGSVGALLGALVGAVPMILITLANYAATYAGILIALGAFYGYKFLRGPMHKPGATLAIICGVTVVGALFAIFTSFTVEFARETAYTTGQIVYLLLHRPSLMLDVIAEYWMCLLFAAGGLLYGIKKILDLM